MVCKNSNCHNAEVYGFRYCGYHLCSLVKKNGNRCQNKKFKNKNFCFIHLYSNDRVNFILGVLGIILAIALVFIGPKLYSLAFGYLKIDFKENDLAFDETGTPSVKIEVLNRLGKDLYYVNGTAILTCENFNQQIKSKTFKLEGGHDFLGDGNSAEFLFSPDPLFVDLVKTKNYNCSDGLLYVALYKKINKTNAKLQKIYSYDFYISGSNYEFTNKSYTNASELLSYNCMNCKIKIDI